MSAHTDGKLTDPDLEQLLASRDHWKNVSRRLLADMDAIRRTIEQVETGLPPIEDHATTVTADDLHFIGSCRVLCEVALQDHAGFVFPALTLAAKPEDES